MNLIIPQKNTTVDIIKSAPTIKLAVLAIRLKIWPKVWAETKRGKNKKIKEIDKKMRFMYKTG